MRTSLPVYGEVRASPRQRSYEKPNTTSLRLEGNTWEHRAGTLLDRSQSAIDETTHWNCGFLTGPRQSPHLPLDLISKKTPQVSTCWGSCICYWAPLQETAPAGTPQDPELKLRQVRVFTVEKDGKFTEQVEFDDDRSSARYQIIHSGLRK